MFADLLRRLTQAPSPAPMDAGDTRLALATLLVRVARADGDYGAPEHDRISRILTHRFALPPAETVYLLDEAERLEAVAPDTVRFTRTLKEGVAYEDRAGIIEALWEVVLADGDRSDDENALLRLTANLLGVNDRDSGLARQRVAARLAGGA